MRKLVLSAIITVIAATSAYAETRQYRDNEGNVWTIEGPAVGNWRPFPGAAQHCPSLHVLAEPTTLFKGRDNATRRDINEAKQRNVQTMHIKCLDTPAAEAPRRRVEAPDAERVQRPQPEQRAQRRMPETIEVLDDGKI